MGVKIQKIHAELKEMMAGTGKYGAWKSCSRVTEDLLVRAIHDAVRSIKDCRSNEISGALGWRREKLDAAHSQKEALCLELEGLLSAKVGLQKEIMRLGQRAPPKIRTDCNNLGQRISSIGLKIGKCEKRAEKLSAQIDAMESLSEKKRRDELLEYYSKGNTHSC